MIQNISDKEKSLKIETSFFASSNSYFFYCANKAQSWLSNIHYFTFISPALWLAKKSSVQGHLFNTPDAPSPSVTLDCLTLKHRLLWKYLKIQFRINSMASGLRSKYKAYQLLLRWNPNVPIIALKEDRVNFSVQLLFGRTESGGRNVDFCWLSSTKKSGTFQIVEKNSSEANNQQSIDLKCVWLSGDNVGKIFTIKRNLAFKDLSKDDGFDSIYYPPRWLIIALELTASATAILTLLRLTKEIWQPTVEILKSFLIEAKLTLFFLLGHLNIF